MVCQDAYLAVCVGEKETEKRIENISIDQCSYLGWIIKTKTKKENKQYLLYLFKDMQALSVTNGLTLKANTLCEFISFSYFSK